jgi:hypothetical protein
MSLSTIRQEVAMILEETDKQIRQAEADLAKGSYSQKVHAAGELSFLRGQHDQVIQRLKSIDGMPEASETLFQWIKEEAFNLKLRIESWIANG